MIFNVLIVYRVFFIISNDASRNGIYNTKKLKLNLNMGLCELLMCNLTGTWIFWSSFRFDHQIVNYLWQRYYGSWHTTWPLFLRKILMIAQIGRKDGWVYFAVYSGTSLGNYENIMEWCVDAYIWPGCFACLWKGQYKCTSRH